MSRKNKQTPVRQNIGTPVKQFKWEPFPNNPPRFGYFLLVFFTLFLSFYALTFIEGFCPSILFKRTETEISPFSASLSSVIPFDSKFWGALTYALMGGFLVLTGSNIITLILASLFILLDGNIISVLIFTPATTIQVTLVVLSLIFEHLSYFASGFNWKWCLLIILEWLTSASSLLLNSEPFGVIVSRFVTIGIFILTSISYNIEKHDDKVNRKFDSSKCKTLLSFAYGSALLIFSGAFYIYKKYINYEVVFEMPDLGELTKEIMSHEEISFWALFFIAIIGRAYVNKSEQFKYSMAQLLIPILIQSCFPIKYADDSVVWRLFFVKIHMVILVCVVFGHIKSQKYSRVFVILFLIGQFIKRIFTKNSTLFDIVSTTFAQYFYYK